MSQTEVVLLLHHMRCLYICRVSSLPAAPRDALFLDLLRGADELQSASPQLLQAAAQVAFVPSPAGKLARPCELYDPTSSELAALLDPQTCFPADAFRTPQAQPPSSSVFSILPPACMTMLRMRSSYLLSNLYIVQTHARPSMGQLITDQQCTTAESSALLVSGLV